MDYTYLDTTIYYEKHGSGKKNIVILPGWGNTSKTFSYMISFLKNYLIDIGYDVNYGARPLKRTVSRTIETMLAEKIISGEIKYGDKVTFDYQDNQLIMRQ